MSRVNAMDETYELVEVFGYPMLFSNARIDRKTVPKGLFMYEIRHADEDWGDMAQIGIGILVNFYGTLISNKEIDLPDKTDKNAFRDIDGYQDLNWLYYDVTITEYMEKMGLKYVEKGEER